LLLSDGVTANTRTARNASGTAVGVGAYSPVWRDKLGTWWVSPSGGGSVELAFCASAVDPFRNGFNETYEKFPYSSAGGGVFGSSLVSLDNANDQVVVTSAGLWHAWGSVTVRVSDTGERTDHRLYYVGPSTSGTFDTQYITHPVGSGTNGGQWDSVYLAGAKTLEANTAVYFVSKTGSSGITGYWLEFNLHLMRT
jgi:hypothetical protein